MKRKQRKETRMSSTYGRSRIGEHNGIALVMVLWVLTVLMVLVFSFSYLSRAETNSALSFRLQRQMKFLAQAGIERGIMEIYYRMHNLQIPDSEVWKTDGTPYTVNTDKGYFTVRITDESGKIDINKTPEVIIRNFLGNHGIELEDIDTIVDSMQDWRDADDLHRLHGAENEYYLSLPTPYEARNADFSTVEELLFVKGMTSEMLYGNDQKRGIFDFLTVHSPSGGININAAPKEVLLSIPGISSEIIDAILVRRETEEVSDVRGLLGESLSLMAPFINPGDSQTFAIESTGFRDGAKAGYTIRATVSISDNETFYYVYYKSPARAMEAAESGG